MLHSVKSPYRIFYVFFYNYIRCGILDSFCTVKKHVMYVYDGLTLLGEHKVIFMCYYIIQIKFCCVHKVLTFTFVRAKVNECTIRKKCNSVNPGNKGILFSGTFETFFSQRIAINTKQRAFCGFVYLEIVTSKFHS